MLRKWKTKKSIQLIFIVIACASPSSSKGKNTVHTLWGYHRVLPSSLSKKNKKISIKDFGINERRNLFVQALHVQRCAQGVLPCEGWGVTASQLDLTSLMPLSVAGYFTLLCSYSARHFALKTFKFLWYFLQILAQLITFC